MRIADRVIMGLGVVGLVVVLSLVFVESLPTWCATPSGAGNWVVQPLCS
jgi:hypothetical protein